MDQKPKRIHKILGHEWKKVNFEHQWRQTVFVATGADSRTWSRTTSFLIANMNFDCAAQLVSWSYVGHLSSPVIEQYGGDK